METRVWHHRKSDRGAVLSGPIGPLCAIRAQSRHHRPAIPVRSVQLVHLPRKTTWKQRLGTTGNRTIGPGQCPIRSDRSDSRHSEVRSMKETQRRPAISVTPVADALSPPATLVTFVSHRAQRTCCRVPPEGRGASPWRRERLRHWTPCPRNVLSRAASASPRPPSRRDRRSFRWRSKDRRSRLRSSRAAAFRGG
jgi:hypothetical protein